MPIRPPSLRAVAAFEAAARHENFGKAADELNLTHSAISHAIRSLEDRLGARLFARVGRTVALTHEGASLAKRVRASLGLLTDALEKRRDLARSRLSIGANAGIATRMLGPHLGAFRALYPEIHIELRSAASGAALAAGDIDLLIRSGAGPDLGISTRLIAPERLYPVAAPKFRGLEEPDLASAEQLIESREHPWSLWFDQRKQKRCGGVAPLAVDTDLLAIEMAKSGLGLCLGPHLLIQQELAEGALVRLGAGEISARSSYHLDWNAASSKHDEIALFLAWMSNTFTAAPIAAATLVWPEGHHLAGLRPESVN